MTSLASVFSHLPEEQLVQMIHSNCANQIAALINSREPLAKKRKKVEELRHHDMVQALPEKAKQEMYEFFDVTLAALEEMRHLRR